MRLFQVLIVFFTHLFPPEIWYQNYCYDDAYKSKYLKPKFDPKISAKFTKRIKARTRNTHTDEYSF